MELKIAWTRSFFYCISLEGLFFFSVGFALAQTGGGNFQGSQMAFKNKVVVCCLLLGLGLVVARTWMKVGPIIMPWVPLFVPMLLVCFWKVVPTCQLPRWLTSAAFPIYLIHVILWAAISKLCVLSGCQVPQFMKVETIGDWWIKWAVGFGGSLLVSLALRRCLPRTSKVLFGGR